MGLFEDTKWKAPISEALVKVNPPDLEGESARRMSFVAAFDKRVFDLSAACTVFVDSHGCPHTSCLTLFIGASSINSTFRATAGVPFKAGSFAFWEQSTLFTDRLMHFQGV